MATEISEEVQALLVLDSASSIIKRLRKEENRESAGPNGSIIRISQDEVVANVGEFTFIIRNR